ncbi:MAG: hypothetical protein ABEL04_13255 [Salinibacter sp.]|uniref:hypothetical protein n=1 Tax=Salinibacter sp. TaxID=2065818 RepID=UPI0035D49AF7
MRYETGPFTVSQSSGGSYGSSSTIDMRVVAQCEGRNCTPDAAKLVFSVRGGQELGLSGVNGQITADGSVFDWSSASAKANLPGTVADNEVNRVLGTFATVEIGIDKLRQIATASSLKGSIGGMPLRLDSAVQSGLLAFLEKIDQAGPSSSGN